MNLNPARTVSELAVEAPGARVVFDRFGIDYCCGGAKSLLEACGIARVDPSDVIRSLNEVAETPVASEPDFKSASLGELINHIVETHHRFTKKEIERLPKLMDKLCDAHAERHPELIQVRSLVRQLAVELDPHMRKEERVLFPFIIEMEVAAGQKRTLPAPPFGSVRNPIRMMMLEHDVAGTLLREIRAVSSDYQLPENACASYREGYQALQALERDLHQHIHLENNLLFPRAALLEEQI